MSRGNADEASPPEDEAWRSNILSIWSRDEPEVATVRGPPSINVLALCGVVIGVASVICRWYTWGSSAAGSSASIWTYLSPSLSHEFHSDYVLVLGSAVFMLGTVAALVTQASGLAQIAGLAVLVAEMPDEAMLGIGFYMGTTSAAVIMASVAYPLGPGFESRSSCLRNRLHVIALGRFQPLRPEARGMHPPSLRMRQLLRRNCKWLSILVAVSAWSITVASYENDLRQDPLLTQVEGGVAIDTDTFGPPASSFLWNRYCLSLYEGDSGAGWNFSNPEIVSGTWCTVNLGQKPLGSLSVSLTVVNDDGGGSFGPGDRLVLVAQDGTSFEEDTTYRIWWKTNMMIAWSGMEICFVFHDGNLRSWVSQEWFGGW